MIRNDWVTKRRMHFYVIVIWKCVSCITFNLPFMLVSWDLKYHMFNGIERVWIDQQQVPYSVCIKQEKSVSFAVYYLNVLYCYSKQDNSLCNAFIFSSAAVTKCKLYSWFLICLLLYTKACKTYFNIHTWYILGL